MGVSCATSLAFWAAGLKPYCMAIREGSDHHAALGLSSGPEKELLLVLATRVLQLLLLELLRQGSSCLLQALCTSCSPLPS